MFMSTNERLSNNLNCYLESVAPEHFPGGGGFSICNFSLETLYNENLILHNWWTKSNENMPLIRFTGCTITLYRQETVDYLFSYNRTYPMNASSLTYTSTHPQAMLLNKNTKIITCKQRSRNKKPYKKLHIKPPVQMQNKWYFQKDLAFLPLLQTMCSACSLDRMFLNSQSISSTMGFVSLDTVGFRNHNFTKLTTTGYYPIHDEKLFGCPNGTPIKQLKITDLCYLGNPDDYDEGTPIGMINITIVGTENKIANQIETARTNPGYQGNPFMPNYFYGEKRVLVTTLSWENLKNKYKVENKTLDEADFRIKQQKFIHCRYNPFKDKGKGNKIYLLKTDHTQHQDDWGPPADQDIVLQDLPLWLATWGYLDYQRKCGILSTVDTNTVFVIYSKYIDPNTLNYYVPLDTGFLEGHSPYTDHLIPSDHTKWHPKVRFQVQSINKIAISGPTVCKLPEQTSCEAHIKYQFYFKFGGQPAPMSTLIDPDDQPKYNTPNNIIQTTSLQSPTTPFEYLLWNFDQRRGQITKAATKRITTDKETESSLFSITDTNFQCPVTRLQEAETSQTSDSEKEETPIEEQLLQQRREQRLLTKRIKQLLNRLTILE